MAREKTLRKNKRKTLSFRKKTRRVEFKGGVPIYGFRTPDEIKRNDKQIRDGHINHVKAMQSKSQLHSMIIMLCCNLYDDYIYDTQTNDVNETEVGKKIPRIYKKELIAVMKIIDKIILEYNKVFNKVLYTKQFKEEAVSSSVARVGLKVTGTYGLWNDPLKSNLTEPLTTMISYKSPDVNTQIAEVTTTGPSVPGNQVAKAVSEDANYAIKETVNNFSEEPQENDNNIVTTELLPKTKLLDVYNKKISEYSRNANDGYLELKIENVALPNGLSHPYFLSTEDNFFAEFEEIKNYYLFFLIFKEKLLEIYNDPKITETDTDIKLYRMGVGAQMAAKSSSLLNDLSARPLRNAWDYGASIGKSINEYGSKSGVSETVDSAIKGVGFGVKGLNTGLFGKGSARGGKKIKKLQYTRKRGRHFHGGILESVWAGWWKDSKAHKEKNYFLIYFSQLTDMYLFNAFDERYLKGIDEDVNQMVRKDFDLDKLENNLNISRAVYDSVAYNRIGNYFVNKYNNTLIKRDSWEIGVGIVNNLKSLGNFVKDNGIFGVLIALAYVVANASFYAIPFAGPLAPVCMMISIVAMSARGGFILMASPIYVDVQNKLNQQSEIKKVCEGFLKKKTGSNELKGKDYSAGLLAGFETLLKIKETKLKLTVQGDENTADNIQKCKESLELFKRKFNESYSNSSSIQFLMDKNKTDEAEKNRYNQLMVYYYRECKILVKNTEEEVNDKIVNLKETLTSKIEKEIKRFNATLTEIITKNLNNPQQSDVVSLLLQDILNIEDQKIKTYEDQMNQFNQDTTKIKQKPLPLKMITRSELIDYINKK